MLLNIFLLCFGIVLLYLGSEWMVRGAASLALSLSIRPVIVGLTVVAFGTSAPEFLVSLIASIKGSMGVSLGNILGSNVANIGLVLGASALVRPLSVDRSLSNREIPFMIGTSALFWLISLDGLISRIDGIILLASLAGFLTMGILTSKKKSNKPETGDSGNKKVLLNASFVVTGSIGLVFGAHFIVNSAIYIAKSMGFSEIFIGLSIVAVGTSLPELATSVVAGVRGEHELSIGNVVGSNVFNVGMVIGTVGVLNPLKVSEGLMYFEFPAMFALSVLLFVFARTGFVISRVEGLVFFLGFFAFVGLSYALGQG
jgi:cation:H+ antiporter